jgi:hypothetical protein
MPAPGGFERAQAKIGTKEGSAIYGAIERLHRGVEGLSTEQKAKGSYRVFQARLRWESYSAHVAAQIAVVRAHP